MFHSHHSNYASRLPTLKSYPKKTALPQQLGHQTFSCSWAKACPSNTSWLLHGHLLETKTLHQHQPFVLAPRSLSIDYVTTLIYSLPDASLIYHMEANTSHLMSLKFSIYSEPFIKWKIGTYETPLFSLSYIPLCLSFTPFLISEDGSNIFFTEYTYQGKEKTKSSAPIIYPLQALLRSLSIGIPFMPTFLIFCQLMQIEVLNEIPSPHLLIHPKLSWSLIFRWYHCSIYTIHTIISVL